MKKTELAVGLICIVAIFILILCYQYVCVIAPVEEPVIVEEESDLQAEGFEEAEDTISYLLLQLENGNIENALRVCAIEDISDYFNMTLYLEYTEDFRGTEMIPTCESEGDGYSVISSVRLAADYGNIIQECIDQISEADSVEVYNIIKDEPENPDGKYFQRMESISNILGARDVAEYVVYMKADDIPLELHLSMVKYRRFWKVLQFSSLQTVGINCLDLSKSSEVMDDMPLDLDSYAGIMLPMNYFLLRSQSFQDTQTMLQSFCMYLQRGDVLSALACYEWPSGDEQQEFNQEVLQKQKDAAVQIQEYYYRMFLSEVDFAWVERHYYDEAEYLPEELRLPNMQYVDFYSIDFVQENENIEEYRISYGYNQKWFESTIMVSKSTGMILGFENREY